MALRFTKTPTKRIVRRKLLRVSEKPRRVIQDYAIDQFGELASRKRSAAETARKLGHDLMPWHQRSNDPAGRWNAYCTCCNMLAVVCTEAPTGFDDIYGHALTRECVPQTNR